MRERAVGSRDLENWSWRLVVEKAWIIGDGEKNRGISPESQLRLPGGRRPFLRQSRAGLHPLPASPASRAHLMVCYSSDSQCDSTPLYYYGSKVDTYCKSSSILISQIPVQGLSGRQDSRLNSTTVHLLRTPPFTSNQRYLTRCRSVPSPPDPGSIQASQHLHPLDTVASIRMIRLTSQRPSSSHDTRKKPLP